MTDKEKELGLAELAREREAGRPYVKEIVLVTYNAWLDDGHWKAPREDALEECAHLLAGASYWSSVRGINTAVPRELKKFFTRNLPQIESHLEHYQREFLAEADLIYSFIQLCGTSNMLKPPESHSISTNNVANPPPQPSPRDPYWQVSL